MFSSKCFLILHPYHFRIFEQIAGSLPVGFNHTETPFMFYALPTSISVFCLSLILEVPKWSETFAASSVKTL